MSFIQALLLGLIQGITEFFPVSSSAHLKLAKYFLDVSGGEELVLFDLACHSGTLAALLIFLRKDVWEVMQSGRQTALYCLALAPLIPVYFLLQPIRLLASRPGCLGPALMITGFLLLAACRKKEVAPSSKKWQHVLWIGVMQTMALIPGISRSGSTIAAARFCGWHFREAARFSFLLGIPTILGGECIQLLKTRTESALAWSCYAAGFFGAFAFGLITVRWMFWVYEKGHLQPFAWYCLTLGLITSSVLHG